MKDNISPSSSSTVSAVGKDQLGFDESIEGA
jgi:hypothetical protein